MYLDQGDARVMLIYLFIYLFIYYYVDINYTISVLYQKTVNTKTTIVNIVTAQLATSVGLIKRVGFSCWLQRLHNGEVG